MEAATESKRFYGDKLKRAVHLLFFKRGRMPGCKGWELRARLGKNYRQVVSQLNELLADLDLEAKEIREGAPPTGVLPEQKSDDSRFFVRLKGTLSLKEARMSGWRIDNVAGLTVVVAYVISKQGKALRKEVEKILATKFGRWKSITLTDVFVRSGYIEEDEAGTISLGWRTKAEVDLRDLMILLAESKT